MMQFNQSINQLQHQAYENCIPFKYFSFEIKQNSIEKKRKKKETQLIIQKLFII